jgi:hypothetical protein
VARGTFCATLQVLLIMTGQAVGPSGMDQMETDALEVCTRLGNALERKANLTSVDQCRSIKSPRRIGLSVAWIIRNE